MENVLTEKATRRNSWEAMPRARTGIRAAEATHNLKGRLMRKKFVAAPLALVTALALAAGPVSADETETDDVATTCVDDVAVDEPAATELEDEPAATELEDEPAATELEEIVEAAEAAAEAAADIVEEEDDGCVTGRDRAKAALQAAVARLSEEGAGGNGVAAEILAALIDGQSPAGIGAGHGEEMANAAAERRAERQAERDAAGGDQADDGGRPDKADKSESNVDDDTETSDDDTKTSDDSESSDAKSGETRGRPADAGRSEGKGHP